MSVRIDAALIQDSLLPGCQREEIRELVLHEHGIQLSSGTISNLTKLFLGYLWKLHSKHIEQLRDALNSDDGWPLHIDATGEDGRGTLLVARLCEISAVL